LFGTYAAEEEMCAYGITKPLASFNPMWAQVHYWIEMARMSARAKGVERLYPWFKGPAWRPGGETAPAPKAMTAGSVVKYDPHPSRTMQGYVLFNYVPIIIGSFFVILYAAQIPFDVLVLGAMAILGGVASMAALMERKRWAKPLEGARIALGFFAI